MTVVFIDLETTGLNPHRNELWEVGLIEEDGTKHLWKVQPNLAHTALGDARWARAIYQKVMNQ